MDNNNKKTETPAELYAKCLAVHPEYVKTSAYEITQEIYDMGMSTANERDYAHIEEMLRLYGPITF